MTPAGGPQSGFGSGTGTSINTLNKRAAFKLHRIRGHHRGTSSENVILAGVRSPKKWRVGRQKQGGDANLATRFDDLGGGSGAAARQARTLNRFRVGGAAGEDIKIVSVLFVSFCMPFADPGVSPIRSAVSRQNRGGRAGEAGRQDPVKERGMSQDGQAGARGRQSKQGK